MNLPAAFPRFVAELADRTRALPLDRKLLVCQTPAQGRELLRALAASGTPWIGWEATSLRALANELIALEVARAGERVADVFDRVAMVDASIERCIARGAAGPFARASEGAFHEALRNGVEQLRMATISPAVVRAAASDKDPKLLAVAEILADYETVLAEEKALDPAAVFVRAAAAVDAGRDLPKGRRYLLPGHSLRGAEGVLIGALLRAGGEVLAGDPVAGVIAPEGVLWASAQGGGPLSRMYERGDVAASQSPQPLASTPRVQGEIFTPPSPAQLELSATAEPANVEMFAAATPVDELREVLRRVVAKGIPWDEVEIVTTDPVVYGAALDGIARRMGIPVTYAGGMDSRRTRVGRAVGRYLKWIGEGFAADVLREMLEAGEVGPPAEWGSISGTGLARRLRKLRIGWGYDRYLRRIEDALRSLAEAPVVAGEQDLEDVLAARKREENELGALRSMLEAILSATPRLPDRARAQEMFTSPAAIARGVTAFLEYVPVRDAAETITRKVIRERMGRIEEALDRETSWEAALETVREAVATNVAPATPEGLATWTSSPGSLHLSELATAGFSGRPHAFVVGLDSGRTGNVAIDPLLTDADRIALNVAANRSIAPLATSEDRVAEKRFRLAAVLARLHGNVTLSYSAWDAAEGRAVSPAPELLQALRLMKRDVTLTYSQLREALGPLKSAVPSDGRAIDDADVWLGALADGRLLRRGVDVVRSAFGPLDRGLSAHERRHGNEVTEYHGRVLLQPSADPRRALPVFSASRLETLGACPRHFFYQYVLGVKPLEDPEWDPDAWLTALERGSLLHSVFEHALQQARDNEISYDDEGFERTALRVLEAEVELFLLSTPSPSHAVFDRELEDLREDVRAWVATIRRDKPDWLELELRFGPDTKPVDVRVGSRSIAITGSIDRVDKIEERVIRIVDYKTGKSKGYLRGAPFDGGRRIQHVIYSHAARKLLGLEVDATQYHFPARRGQGRVVSYSRADLARGDALLETLIAVASEGVFVTTDEVKDCWYCDFGDVCRVERTGEGKVKDSVLAKWSEEIGVTLPEYSRLQDLRGSDA